MNLLRVLFGTGRQPRAKLEALFALSTAQISLQTSLNLTEGRRAGIAFRAAESSVFERIDQEVRDLLAISGPETKTQYTVSKDSYGYTWVILEDEQLEDLIATVHLISTTLEEHGYSSYLLVAVFRFQQQDGQTAYWVYSYKRGAFYPFIPLPGNKRDNSKELRFKAAMETELPIEQKLEQWYPLWDLPV